MQILSTRENLEVVTTVLHAPDLGNGDGVKVQRTNFDLLEEQVELGTAGSRLVSEGQRVAVRQLPLDAGLQADLVHPSACRATFGLAIGCVDVFFTLCGGIDGFTFMLTPAVCVALCTSLCMLTNFCGYIFHFCGLTSFWVQVDMFLCLSLTSL